MYSSIGQKPLETCTSWLSRSKVVCPATEVPGNGYFGLKRRKQGRLVIGPSLLPAHHGGLHLFVHPGRLCIKAIVQLDNDIV